MKSSLTRFFEALFLIAFSLAIVPNSFAGLKITEKKTEKPATTLDGLMLPPDTLEKILTEVKGSLCEHYYKFGKSLRNNKDSSHILVFTANEKGLLVKIAVMADERSAIYHWTDLGWIPMESNKLSIDTTEWHLLYTRMIPTPERVLISSQPEINFHSLPPDQPIYDHPPVIVTPPKEQEIQKLPPFIVSPKRG